MIDQWRAGAEVVYAVRRSRAGEARDEGNSWRRVFTGCSGGWRSGRADGCRGFPAGGPLRGGRAEGDARAAPVHAGPDVLGGVPAGGGGIRPGGALRGEQSIRYGKSVRLAFDAITSFSASPLRWIAVLGVGVCLVAVLWVLYVMVQAMVNPGSMEPRRWASIIAVMVFLGGVQLVGLGMLGQYVGRIFEEGKRRPLYLVREDTKTGGA